ncbi:gas vesicle protein GvpG [Anaerobacterium chartisolvens]|uniref:Gas vesicle protein GvpG n=1 Tax=Anaerobacterium chartisolvens TaxID=1297424 RepID=A0A369AT26_9FIRM|nr:gas vesicle protein GvpG [Anaerobacterium chartisolvens]RCX12522.1 gas vesicle protein GvpG [Anaerobacterium chartisolvens]
MFIFKNLYNLVETITDYALKELYDEQALKKKLMDLALLYEMGGVNEAEFEVLEQKLLKQLRAAREYNRVQAGEAEENEDNDENEGDEENEQNEES